MECARVYAYEGSIMNDRDARERLCEAVQESLLDPDYFVTMVAKWMTNDDIIEMCDANEINLKALVGY
jgi:hypothetical protein